MGISWHDDEEPPDDGAFPLAITFLGPPEWAWYQRVGLVLFWCAVAILDWVVNGG